MQHKAFAVLIALPLMLLLSALSGLAQAQSHATHSIAEVEVDMTVLNGIDSSSPADSYTTLRRPAARPVRPSLTQPDIAAPRLDAPNIKQPAIVIPALPAVTSPSIKLAPTNVNAAHVPPFQVHDKAPLAVQDTAPYPADMSARIRPPRPAAPQNAADNATETVTETAAPRIISFPIKEKRRTESGDPSLAPSGNTPNKDTMQRRANITEQRRMELSGTQTGTSLRPVAVPGASPEEQYRRTVQATGKTVSGIDRNVPLPAHKPAKMVAPASFVKQSRIYAEKRRDNKNMNIKDISKNGMAMPALPAKRVMAEPLSAPPDIGLRLDSPGTGLRNIQNDDLARKLVTPDKAQMIETIEKVVALADRLSGAGNQTGTNAAVTPAPLAQDTGNAGESRIHAVKVPKLAAKGSDVLPEDTKHPVFAIPVDVPLPQKKPDFPISGMAR